MKEVLETQKRICVVMKVRVVSSDEVKLILKSSRLILKFRQPIMLSFTTVLASNDFARNSAKQANRHAEEGV